MAKKKPNQKLSIQEYQALQEKKKKQRFHFEFYPWPVTTVLLIPATIFALLLLTYFLYVKQVAG